MKIKDKSDFKNYMDIEETKKIIVHHQIKKITVQTI